MNPLSQLGYFTEWGGKSWEKLIALAVRDFLGESLDQQHILDVGCRSGKMTVFFALMGGMVTGVEINPKHIPSAQAEAHTWQVKDRTKFIVYDGNLDIFADGYFDLVFTKSVLVVVPNLREFLEKISSKLKQGGKVVFVENGYGNWLFHFLRKLQHRKWPRYRKAGYIGKTQIKLIRELFDIRIVKQSIFPPIYLICGYKPSE